MLEQKQRARAIADAFTVYIDAGGQIEVSISHETEALTFTFRDSALVAHYLERDGDGSGPFAPLRPSDPAATTGASSPTRCGRTRAR